MTIKVDVHFSEEKLETLGLLQEQNLSNLNILQEASKAENPENLAWYNWPEKSGKELIQRLEETASKINFYYDLVVVIGIGGSYSGTKAIDDLFGTTLNEEGETNNSKPILFCGYHLSESYLLQQLRLLDKHQPVICVVSKSGKTIEPNTIHCILEEHLQKRFSPQEIAERTFLITNTEESPLLKNSSVKEKQIFPIPDDLVGRFSILSAASLLPLALAGHKVKSLMRGAGEFFEKLEQKESTILSSLIYAPARNLAWNEGKKIELLAYPEPQLEGFALWWQQLFAESEGKDSKALFPTSSLFSRDLHSLGQYLQEGALSIFETFLITSSLQAEKNLGLEQRIRIPANKKARQLLGKASGHYLDDINHKIINATQKAHATRDIPYCTIEVDSVTEHNFGFLLAFFQTTCVLSSHLLDVNPYNQPGVEAYKKELVAMLHSKSISDSI